MEGKTTVLVTAYAINPYKGSEDGTGWNWVKAISRKYTVVAITRKNNRSFIEEKMKSEDLDIKFLYYDVPKWLSFWKNGARGLTLYYLLWQIGLLFFVRKQKITFDLAHNLNFHCDWRASFLWMLGKPFIWGPIGHHQIIPKNYFHNLSPKERFMEKLKNLVKLYFWKIADAIIGINSKVQKKLNISNTKYHVLPAVGCEDPGEFQKNWSSFNVISIGRFVPLKGFLLSIKAFAKFYNELENKDKNKVTFQIIGKGPELKRYQMLIKALKIEAACEIIPWMPQSNLFQTLKQSHLLFFPSFEGAGMVVPEALSFSIPVLCLDNDGPGELIDDSCGVKVPYTNDKETISVLAFQLKKLFLDKDMLMDLSKQARSKYLRAYKWSRKGEFMDNIYYSQLKDTINIKKVQYEHQ